MESNVAGIFRQERKVSKVDQGEEKRKKRIEKRDAEVLIVASNNNNNAIINNNSNLPSWGGGEDRIGSLAEIGSKGAGTFRQERKVAKVVEGGGEKKKEKECSGLVSVWRSLSGFATWLFIPMEQVYQCSYKYREYLPSPS